MSRGSSLPGLLLGLALGSGAVMLALERYPSLVLGLQSMQQSLSLRQQARLLLFELARDLRMHGQAGCSVLTLDPAVRGTTLQIEYMATDWGVSQLQLSADAQHLTALTLTTPEGAPALLFPLVLSSCHHSERLAPGHGYEIQSQQAGVVRLTFPSKPLVGGEHGHHLASLQVGPLRQRRYRLRREAGGQGVLLRSDDGQTEQQLLSQVRSFSVQEMGAVLRINLLFGRESSIWQLTVAHRQRGSALAVVMVLILAGMLLLASSHRLLLDERRLLQQQEQWWQTLQYAEYTLRSVERYDLSAATRPQSAARFTPDCLGPARPDGRGGVRRARTGLCALPDPDRQVLPQVLRDQRLAPCSSAGCREWTLPHQKLRSRGAPSGTWSVPNVGHNACPENLLTGPFNAHPCAIVELLDAHYANGPLYRVTVRAWGWSARSRVTLQSYFVASTPGQRLQWLELP
jgi:type IV pilus assembly protein PilX